MTEGIRELHAPPFPPLSWNGYFWEGRLLLDAWSGFQSRRGPYASKDSDDPSNGEVSIDLKLPGDSSVGTPSAAQALAFDFLLVNQVAIREGILAGVFHRYDDWRDFYDDDEAEDLMPAISAPGDLRDLIGLASVHFLRVERDGHAYVGFELGCAWDDEHGLGAMTHKCRVVDVGGADSSFVEWIAKRDSLS